LPTIEIKLDFVPFGTASGCMRSHYDNGVFHVECDHTRIPDLRALPQMVAHEIKHALTHMLKQKGVPETASFDEIIRALIGTPKLVEVPKTRIYAVQMRRPCSAYATIEVEAASAQEAISLAKVRVSEDPSIRFEPDETQFDPIDWMHAENQDFSIPHAEADHAEWELKTPESE
jgi:hypothetical protein